MPNFLTDNRKPRIIWQFLLDEIVKCATTEGCMSAHGIFGTYT